MRVFLRTSELLFRASLELLEISFKLTLGHVRCRRFRCNEGIRLVVGLPTIQVRQFLR